MSAPATHRIVARVEGRVQGVGFRHFVAMRATSLDLAGTVRNLPMGEVEVVAEGPRPSLEALIRDLHVGPPLARVRSVVVEWRSAEGAREFRIRTT